MSRVISSYGKRKKALPNADFAHLEAPDFDFFDLVSGTASSLRISLVRARLPRTGRRHGI